MPIWTTSTSISDRISSRLPVVSTGRVGAMAAISRLADDAFADGGGDERGQPVPLGIAQPLAMRHLVPHVRGVCPWSCARASGILARPQFGWSLGGSRK